MPETAAAATRWELLRDVLAFQVKLAVDALRDVMMSPISLIAAILDLVTGDREQPYFYQVLQAGRRSETWINLFGAASRPEAEDRNGAEQPRNLDGVVRRVEAMLVEQYERGGVTAQAKDAIDRSLDSLVARRTPGEKPSEPPG